MAIERFDFPLSSLVTKNPRRQFAASGSGTFIQTSTAEIQLAKPSSKRSEKILAIVYSDCIGLAPTDVGKMLLSIT